MAEKRGTRFAVIYQEATIVPLTQILVDKETGIQYLVHCPLAGAAGMTVLLGQDGKPLLYKD